MRVLLTNDDGIDSPGIHALARALATVAEVIVVAPASNQSAVARGITIRGTLEIEERDDVAGATAAYAVSGTPVDCVRFAVATEPESRFDLVVAGTAAAAMEGVLLGTPGLAVSQQSMGGELHHTRDGAYEFATAERIVPHLAKRLASGDLGRDVLLNVNCPTGVPQGIRICKLGRRIWADQIELAEEHDGRRRFRLYSGDADYHRAPGTDFEAVADGSVAITALHVNWEHPEGTTLLAGLTGLLDDA